MALTQEALDKGVGAKKIVDNGLFVGKEPGSLKWLVETAQSVTEAPYCIDSHDPKVIKKALAAHNGVAMINSIPPVYH